MNIGIVGLGLMGASYAARLKERGQTIYGFARRQETIDKALEYNIVDKGTIHMEDGLLHECEIIILGLYPTALKPWIEQNQQYLQDGCVIMDISGVKSNIIEPIEQIVDSRLSFVSTHPMCGRESQGIEHYDPTIFDGANYIVIETDSSNPKDVQLAKAIGHLLGCKNIEVLDIENHDRMIGFLSQLTHVIAVSLMNTHENEQFVKYTGDSFRDLTRIAAINEDMWTELFLLNKEILLDETNQFIDTITHFRDALKSEDSQEMKQLFIQSTKRRQKFNK